MIEEEFEKLLRRLHKEGGIPEFKGINLDTGEEIKLSAYALFGCERGMSSVWCWSTVVLTNRRLIILSPWTDYSKIRDFRLEDPNFVVDLSEHIFKFQSGLLNRVSVYYKLLLLKDTSCQIVVKDADRWKEEIHHLQHARRKEYAGQLLSNMPDFPEEILLDPNEEVILRGVGVVHWNIKLLAQIYLTSRRLITITVFPGLSVEHIIGLEQIYRLRVDEGGLMEIDFKPIERNEIGWILLELYNSDIEHWKNEIVRSRNIRIKRIEDH